MAARLKEAAKLGFGRAIVPAAGLEGVPAGLSLESVATIGDLVARLAGGEGRKPR
jgi:DNA repair protein RadA/Sms